jgi:hypothetical protein
MPRSTFLGGGASRRVIKKHSTSTPTWDFCKYLAAKKRFFIIRVFVNNYLCTNKSSTWRDYLCTDNFLRIQGKNGHFVMCIRIPSQQKQYSPTRIRKRTATNKNNLRNPLLGICVSICELKKSQPMAVISLENIQIILCLSCDHNQGDC